MVQVITDNGKFNITESLLEAIKSNNPSILEAKKTRDYEYEQIILPKLRKLGITDVKQITPMLNQIEKHNPDILHDVKKTTDIIIKMIQQKNEKKQKENSEVVKSDSEQQIIDAQVERNSNVSADIKAKASPEAISASEEKKNTTELVNNNSNNSKPLKTKEYDIKPKTIEEFVKSQELRKNIQETEALAANIVKRVKGLIQSYAGLGGSNTSATKTKFSDDSNNNIQSNVKNSKKYRQVDAKNNNDEVKDIENYSTYSDIGRKTKSELQLALGGFKLSPYFGHKGYNGRALKYYKLATRNTDYSLIDDMIQKMIDIKGGMYQLTNKDKEYYQQFENMVYNFLHNTVYRLEVNNDNHYNNVITIIRNDPSLRDMFEVEFNNVVQQFDTKENIISYRNKNDKIIDLLIISTPMFYQGKKIFKDLSKIAGYGKQLKA